MGPVAAVHIPHRVPIGFHGNWIPDSELAQQRKALGRDERRARPLAV